MSIDKTIFLYDNLLNGDLFEHTQSISVGVHLYSSLFFIFPCMTSVSRVIIRNFIIFILYLYPISSKMTMWKIHCFSWSLMILLKQSNKFDKTRIFISHMHISNI